VLAAVGEDAIDDAEQPPDLTPEDLDHLLILVAGLAQRCAEPAEVRTDAAMAPDSQIT
jgi:hypothetical protein